MQYTQMYMQINFFTVNLQSRGIISESLLSSINMMVYDECLSNALPDLQVLLLGYIKQLDEGRYNVYVSTATVCQSLQKTCKFLTLCQEEVNDFLEIYEITFMNYIFLSLQCFSNFTNICYEYFWWYNGKKYGCDTWWARTMTPWIVRGNTLSTMSPLIYFLLHSWQFLLANETSVKSG